MDEELVVGVRAVYVGEPTVLGDKGGKPVLSAIGKTAVTGGEVMLRATNLDGDRQADLHNHGGIDKAVYLYPVEGYAGWQADGFALEPGDVGENVALTGATETQVRVGDVFAWGDALIEVSQPRQPCFKLAMRTRRIDITPAMIRSGRCGWYARVLTPGLVPTSGQMRRVRTNPEHPTVAQVNALAFPAYHPPLGDRAGALRAAVGTVALAAGWREDFARTLAELEAGTR